MANKVKLSFDPKAFLGIVDIGAGKSPSHAADVWLVRYDPNVVEVPVARGENTGRTLPHTHVVHALQRIGGWDGKAQSFKISDASAGLRNAILIQTTKSGPILAAISD